ncbi:MAG: hydantoinase/oxoprolinase family protein [Burkholderiales bacterium]
MASVRIGVDIGGTFTDVVVFDEGGRKISFTKVPSRRGDPAGALVDSVERGLELAKVDARDVTMLVHGSTIVTNAVLESKLPKTALVTTAGFRDVLEIGRHFRPDMYDLQQDKPPPVVPRERRFTVAERTAADGTILVAPDPKELEALAAAIRDCGALSVAVCFLNSYANPANETAVRAFLERRLPGVPVCASCDVCPEIREFERMSTVVLNAAAMPLVGRYLEELAARVKAVLPNSKILLMQSNGGSLPVASARTLPARLITSGPAGGALAIQRIGKATAYPNLLGLDMGGTSTDISLIQKGELRMTTDGSITDRPIKLPMIEINTIGAGAGSIAWLDQANGLHVGPHSAGSEPGPVAYRTGGTEPTVTDANLVLGRLNPKRFASGRIALDVEASRAAIAQKIAAPLGMSVEQAALGIIRIANANMERAVRVSSAEKGYDPRDLMLVAFGGAGPMHAAALAKSAGIPTVLVPEQPGVLSAVGLVMADIRHDFVQTKVARGAALGGAHLEPLYAGLRRLGDEALAKDGIAAEHRVFRRSADLRYAGQAYEVNVEVPDGALDDAAVEAMRRRFHAMHKQLFAHNHPDKVVEFVSGRLTAIGLTSAPSILPRALTGGDVRPVERHRVYYEETGAYVDTPVYERATLVPGCRIDGPAIVEQSDTTTIIHPGQRADVDPYGNLLVHTGGAADAR